MRAAAARMLGTLALLLAAPGFAHASEQAERLLRDADQIRSSQPAEFNRQLRQLDLRSDLDPQQREYLSYLHAYSEVYRGNFAAAIGIAKPLADKGTDPDLRVRAGALLVNSYTLVRRFADGLRQLNQTVIESRGAVDPEVRHHVLHVAAMLHNEIGQYRLGESYANRLLAERDISERTRCFTSQLRFEAMLAMRTLPVGDEELDRAISRCKDAREPVVANFILAVLARKMASDGRRMQAVEMLERAMPEVESTRFPNLIGQSHSLLGELLVAAGRDGHAARHAEQAVVHAGDMGRSLSLIAAYRTLYEVAERRGDMRTALRYYRQYSDADVDYLSEVNAREMAYQVVRQELQQKGQQISLLNHQNRVLQLQRQVERQSARNLQVLVALLALLLTAIAYWAYRVKRMEQTLRRRSEVDALSGVYSRQHFTRCVEKVLVREAAHGTESALLMFDLDNFKACNDRHGHEVGDWALTRAAQACAALCRDGDLIGRLGGEEFAMFLPSTGREEALRIAEACRRALEAIDSAETGRPISITASFGVAMSGPAGHDLTLLMSQADKALYRAKHEGRNRVRAFDESMAAEHAASPRLRLAHPPQAHGEA